MDRSLAQAKKEGLFLPWIEAIEGNLQMSNALSIANGPDLMKLVFSLAEGNPTPRKKVTFKLEGLNPDCEVAITGLKQEDGSGNSWIFEGYCTSWAGKLSGEVHGLYDSQIRKGWLYWGSSK